MATVQTPQGFRLANQASDLMLLVDTAKKHYYSTSPLERLTPFFSAATELQIANLSEERLQTIIAGHALKAKPFTQLLWFATFSSSQGKLIQGHKQGDIVQLKRWPDLNLPGCKRLIKLAAYMHSNAVDLETVQASTGIAIGQIHNFYNACKVLDLIVHSQHTDIHGKTLDAEQKQLLEKIGKRLDQSGRLRA